MSQKLNKNFVMGYTFNLCKSNFFIVPYNQNIRMRRNNKERIEGFRKAFEPGETLRWEVPKTEKERMSFYDDKYTQLLKSNVTAAFAVSDFYAVEFMKFLQEKNIRILEDIQIIGFDDSMASRESNPSLTTIHQEAALRAKTAIECLEAMRNGVECETEIVLPVGLIKRESTRKL